MGEVSVLELDTKQKVLLAIYTEYQKDIPNMRGNITAEKLGIQKEAFTIALEKLNNEKLVNNIQFSKDGHIGIVIPWVDDMTISSYGINYIETKLHIRNNFSGKEKVVKITKEVATWGWEQFKDIAAKTLSEMLR